MARTPDLDREARTPGGRRGGPERQHASPPHRAAGAFAKCAGRLPGRPRVARRMFGEFFFDDVSYTQPPPEKATLNLQPVFPFDPDVTPPDSFELEFGSAYYE